MFCSIFQLKLFRVVEMVINFNVFAKYKYYLTQITYLFKILIKMLIIQKFGIITILALN